MFDIQSRLGGFLAARWQRRGSEGHVVVPPYVAHPAGRHEGVLTDVEYRPQGRRFSWWLAVRKLARLCLLFSPTLLAIVYFGFIATPRYASEVTFVIRNSTRPIGTAGFGALLQMSGLTRAQDDVYAVHDYLVSHDAVHYLRENLDMLAIYGRPGADFLARYPSIIYGRTRDEFYRFFQHKLTVNYSAVTGITTVQVQAFRPEDSRNVVEALLVASEALVNRMNSRLQQDAIALSAKAVKAAEEKLLDVQLRITDFRNRELMIDPGASSLVVTDLIGRLSGALVEVRTQLREMSMSAPNNPQRVALERRAEAIEGQIDREKSRISSDDGGLATKLAHYERLVTEREIARNALAAATGALEAARAEARRQQLYLERIVQPNMPDFATKPERLRSIATAAALNLLLLMMGWLILTGVREHAQSAARDRR